MYIYIMRYLYYNNNVRRYYAHLQCTKRSPRQSHGSVIRVTKSLHFFFRSPSFGRLPFLFLNNILFIETPCY